MRETGSPLNSSTKNDGIGIFEITHWQWRMAWRQVKSKVGMLVRRLLLKSSLEIRCLNLGEGINQKELIGLIKATGLEG